MGLSKSKYDVQKIDKEIVPKLYAKKEDKAMLQMINEVKKSIKAAEHRTGPNGAEATSSKNIEHGENPDNETEIEESNVKAGTVESEVPKFEKVRKHEDKATTVEGVKPEKTLVGRAEESNEDGRKETPEIKQEIQKEKQELLIEPLKNENPSVATDNYPIQKTKDKEIEEEMMKAIVNHQKHEDNEDASPQYGAQSRNVSEIPKLEESASCTIEENKNEVVENENKITVGENPNPTEDEPKRERKVSFNLESKIDQADGSKAEINADKLQSEIKSDCNIQEIATIEEEVKKKIAAEAPTQTESVAEETKSIEITANDIRAENKTHINKEEHNNEESKRVQVQEENQLVRTMEDQETTKPDEVEEETNLENKELEKGIHNKEIEVDIEVHQIKGNIFEENTSQEVLHEENQSGNTTEVKLSEENVKETVHQGEDNKAEDGVLEKSSGEEQKQDNISEMQSNTEEKAIEKPSIINKPTVMAPGDREEIPNEDNLFSTETLSKKSEETESNQLSEGQLAGEQVISKEVHPILQRVQEIEEQTKVLKEQIIQFTGTDKDVEYRILNEALIKNMLKLDDLSVEKGEGIRAERKRVIQFVQECLKTLERNVVKTKDDGDSDSN